MEISALAVSQCGSLIATGMSYGVVVFYLGSRHRKSRPDKTPAVEILHPVTIALDF